MMISIATAKRLVTHHLTAAGEIVENQHTPEKSKANNESPETHSESGESVASDRFRDEFQQAQTSETPNPNHSVRSYEANAVEQRDGAVIALTFDDSVFGDSRKSHQDFSLNSKTTTETTPEMPHHASFTDAEGNSVVTDAQGNITITSADGNRITHFGADGRGYERTVTANGYVENHFGQNPRDNYQIERTMDHNGPGAFTETYRSADGLRDYTRVVGQDGRAVVTDNTTGLRIELRGGSPAFQERVLNQLLELPQSHRQRLRDNNINIAVVSRPVDARVQRDYAGRPTLGGLYDVYSRTVVIGEHNNAGERIFNPERLTRHEIGHALDHTMGPWYSRTGLDSSRADFQRAFEADRANMSDDDAAVNSGIFNLANPQAEVLADIYAGLTTSDPGERLLSIMRAFPRFTEILRQRLAALR